MKIKQFIKKLASKKRKGIDLAQIAIGLVIIVTLAATGLIAGSQLMNSANKKKTFDSISNYSEAIRLALIEKPQLAKYKANDLAKMKLLVEAINQNLEEDMRFNIPTGTTGNGGITSSAISRDAWGNSFGLYFFDNSTHEKYSDDTGDTMLKASDSQIVISVVSAGKDGVGGPAGIDGGNMGADGSMTDVTKMVSNTDGKDDMGLIVRVLNGETRITTFGQKSGIGELKGTQWVLGIADTPNGGINYNFNTSTNPTLTKADSINAAYDTNSFESYVAAGYKAIS